MHFAHNEFYDFWNSFSTIPRVLVVHYSDAFWLKTECFVIILEWRAHDGTSVKPYGMNTCVSPLYGWCAGLLAVSRERHNQWDDKKNIKYVSRPQELCPPMIVRYYNTYHRILWVRFAIRRRQCPRRKTAVYTAYRCRTTASPSAIWFT